MEQLLYEYVVDRPYCIARCGLKYSQNIFNSRLSMEVICGFTAIELSVFPLFVHECITYLAKQKNVEIC